MRDVFAAAIDGDGEKACALGTERYRREIVLEAQADPLAASAKPDTCEEAIAKGAALTKKSFPGFLPEGVKPTFSRFALDTPTPRGFE